MTPRLSSLLFLVVGISMALAPWLAAGGQLLASRFELHDVGSLLPVESEEIDREKAARLELERTARLQPSSVPDQSPITKHKSVFENGNLTCRLSSASSLNSMEESFFLQASLDSSDSFSEWRNPVYTAMSPYFMKSMTPSAFEASLRQKEGELASYRS